MPSPQHIKKMVYRWTATNLIRPLARYPTGQTFCGV